MAHLQHSYWLSKTRERYENFLVSLIFLIKKDTNQAGVPETRQQVTSRPDLKSVRPVSLLSAPYSSLAVSLYKSVTQN